MSRLLPLLPFLLGAAAVLQGVLNRRIAQHLSLPGAVLLNASVLLLASLGLFLLSRGRVGPFAALDAPSDLRTFGLWWLLPGLLGLTLVLGIPYAIHRVGAFTTFLGILVAQLVTSLIWDAIFEHRGPTLPKLLGAALAVAGAWLVNWSR